MAHVIQQRTTVDMEGRLRRVPHRHADQQAVEAARSKDECGGIAPAAVRRSSGAIAGRAIRLLRLSRLQETTDSSHCE
jgi:hypothetical protein